MTDEPTSPVASGDASGSSQPRAGGGRPCSPSSLAPSQEAPCPGSWGSAPPTSVCTLVLTGPAPGTPHSPGVSPASLRRVDRVRMRTPGSEGPDRQEGSPGEGECVEAEPLLLFSPEPPTASPSLRSKPTTPAEAIPRTELTSGSGILGPWVRRWQGPGLLHPSLTCALAANPAPQGVVPPAQTGSAGPRVQQPPEPLGRAAGPAPRLL